MNSYIYFKRKIKNTILVIVIFCAMALWFWYMLWASKIGRNTILMKSIPEFMSYITFGCIIGLVFAGCVTYQRPENKTPAHILETFLGGFCIGFVCILHCYDVCTYLLPGEIIRYESDYELTFPGPAIGKSSRCEAGLWIKDAHTTRWIQLCTNKSTLFKKQQYGMDAVWITARSNRLGSYIVDYQFINRQTSVTVPPFHNGVRKYNSVSLFSPISPD
ncbi:hypothetical protein SJI19_05840 [Acerihabitans sp. TG2]|uniref:hypothetical protein n=1 Tax=Acerihabitans sp. TG2 TaxID=3096008 RepID=UPI002B2279AD|nr:hypothetical protein [Acerihabitans sp. TG2]MEA9390075.1 hypothetical protein [Acerihabitans sp. TG2]